MKKIILVFIFITTGVLSALHADIHFELNYTDEPGTGFHIRPEAKKALEEACLEYGSWFEDEGVVRLDVNSHVFSGKRPYEGQGFIMLPLTRGFWPNFVQQKILSGKQDEAPYDGILDVAFSDNEQDRAYGDEVGSKEVDFKSMVFHELTHIFGFTSFTEEMYEERASDLTDDIVIWGLQKLQGKVPEYSAESLLERYQEFVNRGINVESELPDFTLYHLSILMGIDESPYQSAVEETRAMLKNLGMGWAQYEQIILDNYELFRKGILPEFDKYIVDSNGNRVINDDMQFIRKDLSLLEDGDPKKQLYFLNNNGTMVPLNGMESSHVPQCSGSLMAPHMQRGMGVRELTPDVRIVLEQLGYSLKPLQESIP